MKLFQVRKGQFVYYNNELHKVYSVKPMFKKSIHLYRLKDMKQVLSKASDIQLYKPKSSDSFIFYGKRYTIDENKRPEAGDYILIVKPTPDFLDHYSLNEIEKVDNVEDGNVVTTRDNGVKHNEYVLLVPGQSEESKDIAYFDKNLVTASQQAEDETLVNISNSEPAMKPVVGDIYADIKSNTKAMIVAMSEDEVIFGHGVKVHVTELMDEEKFTLIYRSEEDL